MRTGLVRIELVVTASLAVLVCGLVVPRIQAARTDAAREQCKNNLRIIGQGCLEYEKVKGGMPPRRSGFNDGSPYAGWGAHILPYLDEPELAKKYNYKLDFFDPANKPVVETQVKAFKCPASPVKRTTPIQSQASPKADNPDKDTPFKVEAGVNDYIASNGSNAPRNGYGLNATQADAMGGNSRQAMIDNDPLPFSKITDGLSCTILVVEQAGRPELWRAGKKKEGDGAQFGMANNARGAWAGWGSIVIGPGGADGGPARGDFTDVSVNSNNQFGVYAFHEGGAHILLCDGSVRFAGKNLAPLTLVYLITRDDGHLISPTDY
jgi:prepilin-type processing-associated H-X9-DG protein